MERRIFKQILDLNFMSLCELNGEIHFTNSLMENMDLSMDNLIKKSMACHYSYIYECTLLYYTNFCT